MWQCTIAAFLIFVTSSIGWYANGHLLILLFFRKHPYVKYTFWLTVAKAVTNIMILLIFVLTEIPSLIVEKDLYPELVFRIFGAIAGLTVIPNRLFQFFISFGTLFISFLPFRKVPKPIFILSILLPSAAGIMVFSIRISSEDCSYLFSSAKIAWFYFAAPCAQFVRKLTASLVGFQILSCCFFNAITFIKLVMDYRQKNFESSENKVNRTKWRLLQCVAQDILFIIDISVYFNESERRSLLVNFIFNTFIWNLGHTVDGLIMWAMLNKIKIISKTSVSVIITSIDMRHMRNKI